MRPLEPNGIRRVLIRAANWVGDAVMALPAIRAAAAHLSRAEISILARPWVADVYAREPFVHSILPYHPRPGARDFGAKRTLAQTLRARRFDLALLMTNSFESAALVRLAGIPLRAGYSRDARGWLLTHGVPRPAPGSLPRHESYSYLHLMHELGLADEPPAQLTIRLAGLDAARTAGKTALAAAGFRTAAVVGLSPGAAYGGAKRWLPERFAEVGVRLAREIGGSVAVFGSSGEKEICAEVARGVSAQGVAARSLAGETSLAGFIDMASACRVFVTNDSGSMHIASAAGVPVVAVFGATDEFATGPTGPLAHVVREPVDCAPCLRRECPIDHRCMTRVEPDRVADVALELLK